MAKFGIDKGVPMPVRTSAYPLAEMEVGDSFFVPNGKTKNVNGCIGRKAKEMGIKVSVRAVNENGVTGVRVWRTE